MSGDPGFAALTSLLREVVLRLQSIENAIEREHVQQDRPSERLWTVTQVAEFLGRSKRSVYQLAAEGTLPAIRLGGHLRFDPAGVRQWVLRKTAQ